MHLGKLKSIRSHNIDDYRHPFERLLASDELEQLVARWLTRALAGEAENFDPGTIASGSQIILYKDDWINMGLRYLPAQAAIESSGQPEFPYLMSTPTHLLVGVLGGAMLIDLYEVRQLERKDVLDRSARLERRGARVFASGSYFEQRPTQDVLDVREVTTGVVLVEFALRAQDPLVWHFDRTTMLACNVSSSDVHATRQQFCAAILRRLCGAGAAPDLRWLAVRSPSHFVRWTALKHLIEVDLVEALPVLRATTDDPHPHVRSAALRTLENLTRAGRME
ncbi:HEAT repeat domain-containing protein [Sorangium sp. So ce367]|uniref:HEAT repeat domain-containing protein n=1 Tax=Sorangium sp. So ce367 TaxID=3133305 RepID=UPI003F5F0EF9